jgi:glucose repression regulatory protein TUP1
VSPFYYLTCESGTDERCRVVCCVRFSPDGKVLATGCNRNTTLYDTKTGAKISYVPCSYSLCGCTDERGCSVLYDESSGLKVDNYIRSASFSPDGKLLATGSEDRIVRVRSLPFLPPLVLYGTNDPRRM